MRALAVLLLLPLLVLHMGHAALAGTGQGSPKSGTKPLKIGFVYISPVGDAGWSYAHDMARRALANDPSNITYVADGVPGGNDAERVIKGMSANGLDLIITTSFSFMDPTVKVAAQYPHITYLHCSGYKTASNLSNYFGRMYQARYLSGMVAGGMTKSNSIGFVAAFPIPEVIRGLNAFTLGVRAVNPDAEVRVIWSHTWYDPPLERKYTEQLISEGADVIAQDQDSPTPQIVAQEKGVYSVGYNSDMRSHAPDAHLTAAVWDWQVFYRKVLKDMRAGLWKSGSFWLGMETGIVDITPFGSMVPDDLRVKVRQRRQEIIDGRFQVFQGPLRDRDGKPRIADGVVPEDRELLEMEWFVEGVSGSAE